jgi:hypothetical protein
MHIVLDCDSNIFLDASKDINKIVEWAKNHREKYFNIINKLDGAVLIQKTSELPAPSWYTFDDISIGGDVTNLRLVMTDSSVQAKLYTLTKRLKKMDCNIKLFETNPLGLHPYFVFTKNKHQIVVVIEKNTLNINVSLA